MGSGECLYLSGSHSPWCLNYPFLLITQQYHYSVCISVPVDSIQNGQPHAFGIDSGNATPSAHESPWNPDVKAPVVLTARGTCFLGHKQEAQEKETFSSCGPGFSSLSAISTWDHVILWWGADPCIVSRLAATLAFSCDNWKYLQTLPGVTKEEWG